MLLFVSCFSSVQGQGGEEGGGGEGVLMDREFLQELFARLERVFHR